jgi:hypothetical protein
MLLNGGAPQARSSASLCLSHAPYYLLHMVQESFYVFLSEFAVFHVFCYVVSCLLFTRLGPDHPGAGPAML